MTAAAEAAAEGEGGPAPLWYVLKQLGRPRGRLGE